MFIMWFEIVVGSCSIDPVRPFFKIPWDSVKSCSIISLESESSHKFEFISILVLFLNNRLSLRDPVLIIHHDLGEFSEPSCACL